MQILKVPNFATDLPARRKYFIDIQIGMLEMELSEDLESPRFIGLSVFLFEIFRSKTVEFSENKLINYQIGGAYFERHVRSRGYCDPTRER